jgi:hypothetical protein
MVYIKHILHITISLEFANKGGELHHSIAIVAHLGREKLHPISSRTTNKQARRDEQ